MNYTELFPLPTDITNLILEFSGYHKFRHGLINGIYVRQLDVNCSQIVELHERLLARPQMKKGYVILHFSKEASIALFHQTYSCYNENRRL
jgi:hypothetical protein